ncbi:MAG: response regulator [Pseudomonadota bacterium]
MANFNISKFKFLHIDDFGNYRSMLKSILRSIGVIHMDDAKDAVDAMEKIKHQHYDVILCDYNLGDGQNGQQFLEEAMSRQLLPYGTIFIMITAENTMDMVMAAVEYRPDAYLSKPFPKEILIKRLEKLMAKKATFKPIYTAYNKQDYNTALNLCDQSMKEAPKLAIDLGKLKAEIALKAKDFDLAESIYNKALAIRPFDWAQYGKGKTLFEKGEHEQAQKILEVLIKENKNYIEAYDILAQIYKKNKDITKTQEVLQAATNISPRAISRQQHLSKIALENGDFTVAEKSLRSSINLGKHSYLGKMDDHTELTKLYLDNGKTNQAAKVINNAKKQYRKDSESLFHAQVMDSVIQFKLGNEEKSREIFENLILNMPDEIHSLPDSIQQDLISNGELLNENEMVQSLKDDIIQPNSTSSIDTEDQKNKYKYLLLNGKGMRLYNSNKISSSMPLFEEAAQQLPENISINMNAAQAIIMILKKSPNRHPEIKQKARLFLDISKKLDSSNDKYQKLEALYSGLI